MNGILLSAGLGARLRPYTELTPKPAIPFMSVPLACYPLALFEDHKIDNLVVNTHHLPEKIRELFGKIKWPMKKSPGTVIFSPEKNMLGSGGGVRQALPHLLGRGTFFVANADEVILPQHFAVMKEALGFHRHHQGIATLLCVRHEQVGKKFGGVWTLGGTRVNRFSKTPVPGHQGLHFIGIILLDENIQKYFFDDPTKEENILYDTLTKAMTKGEEVHAFEVDAQWFESGNPEDFLQATETCLKEIQERPPKPWAEYLRQLICRCSSREFQIENDQPNLKIELADRLSKLFVGEL